MRRMGEPQDKIGLKEYMVMAIFLIGVKVTDDIPAMLFDSMKNAGWMGPIISGIIALLPLFFLLSITKKYPNLSAFDIFYQSFGKLIGFFFLFLLWISGFFYIVLDTAIYADIVSTMYFVRTPTIILYATFVGIAAYGAKK